MQEKYLLDWDRQVLKNHDIKMVNWYYQKIDEMRLDMVFHAEEANYWLNIFEKSHLSDAGKSCVAEMRNKIKNNQYPLAYEIGRNLARISQNKIDTAETAEAWVAIGLSSLQMGNPRQAVDYFQRGAVSFNPWGHHQAVTRWMMGIAQWQIPGEIDQAVRNWTNAIDAFEALKVTADRENDQVKNNWYEMSIKIMRTALHLKLSGES